VEEKVMLIEKQNRMRAQKKIGVSLKFL